MTVKSLFWCRIKLDTYWARHRRRPYLKCHLECKSELAVFDSKKASASKSDEKLKEELYCQINQLKVELD